MTLASESADARPLGQHPMSHRQWQAVGLTAAINALDGFDLLAVSFAAPKLTIAWGLSKATLGTIIGAGLVGVAVGSAFVAPWADLSGGAQWYFRASR